jgi:hypothetical protein
VPCCRPQGWDGDAEAQQRSRQLGDELLALLEEAAAQLAGAAAAKLAPCEEGGEGQHGSAHVGASVPLASDAEALPAWRYALLLAGHCCAAGLLDGGRLAEWAVSSRVLLPLPPAARRQLLELFGHCVRCAPLAQQQALDLTQLCLSSSKAAAAAAPAGVPQAGPGDASRQQRRRHQQQERQRREAEELRGALLAAAQQLVELHPAAFVAADEALLQPLRSAPSGSPQRAAVDAVDDARRRLSLGLHARCAGGGAPTPLLPGWQGSGGLTPLIPPPTRPPPHTSAPSNCDPRRLTASPPPPPAAAAAGCCAGTTPKRCSCWTTSWGRAAALQLRRQSSAS